MFGPYKVLVLFETTYKTLYHDQNLNIIIYTHIKIKVLVMIFFLDWDPD